MGDEIGMGILQSLAPLQIPLYVYAICCFPVSFIHEPKATNPLVTSYTEFGWLEFGSRNLLENPLIIRFPKCQSFENQHHEFSHICVLQVKFIYLTFFFKLAPSFTQYIH